MKNNSLKKIIITVLQFLLCAVIAFAIWFIVQYTENYNNTQEEAATVINTFTVALRVL